MNKTDVVYGACGKHPNFPLVNCPICKDEANPLLNKEQGVPVCDASKAEASGEAGNKTYNRFKENFIAHADRLLRDRGASNKDVFECLEMAFDDLQDQWIASNKTLSIDYVYVEVSVEEFRKENPLKEGGFSYPMISERGKVHQIFDFELENYGKSNWKVLKKAPLSSLISKGGAEVEKLADTHSKVSYARAPKQSQEDADYIQAVSKYSFMAGYNQALTQKAGDGWKERFDEWYWSPERPYLGQNTTYKELVEYIEQNIINNSK